MTKLDKPILFLATADATRAREFYVGVLGLEFVADEPVAVVFRVGESMLRIQKVQQVSVAPYTAMGWEVADIREVVRMLGKRGVKFLRFEGMEQDGDGIWAAPSGARIAWFKDPDGHVLSVTEFGK